MDGPSRARRSPFPARDACAVTAIAELLIADDPAAWRDVGFTVDDQGRCRIGTVTLRLDPAAGAGGIVAWTLAGAPDEEVGEIDGLPTRHGEPAGGPAPSTDHPIGARSIDHLVVMTPDVDRTVQTVAARLGIPLKRTRDGEAYGRPVRQAFFRMGEVILEVVGPPEPEPAGGPARFFGLAVTLDSLTAARDLLGPDRMGEPRPAVQPGRHITTIRSAAGLRVAVALMDAAPGR